jgi:hypothetical protein
VAPASQTLRRKKKKPKQDAYLAGVSDRKLKGQLKHTERLYKEANKAAAHINQWLAPAEAGFVEAEGDARLTGTGTSNSNWQHQQEENQSEAATVAAAVFAAKYSVLCNKGLACWL